MTACRRAQQEWGSREDVCCLCSLAGLEAEVALLFPRFSWCQKGRGQSVEGASWKEGLVSGDDSAPAAPDAGS